ncbi:MAG: hypothetical protein ABIG96_04685 [Candidatus Micrarchaeota archaeon]
MPKEAMKASPANFNWMEFLSPNWIKAEIIVLLVLIAVLSTFIIFPIRWAISPSCEYTEYTYGSLGAVADAVKQAITLLIGAIYFVPYMLFAIGGGSYVTANITGSPIPFFTALIAFLMCIAYLYLLSCLLYFKREIAKKLLLVAVVVFLLVPFLHMYSQKQVDCSIGPSKVQCMAQIARMSQCYDSNGDWNPNGCGSEGCLSAENGLTPECLTGRLGLNGTPWKRDETHFNCGSQPA